MKENLNTIRPKLNVTRRPAIVDSTFRWGHFTAIAAAVLQTFGFPVQEYLNGFQVYWV